MCYFSVPSGQRRSPSLSSSTSITWTWQRRAPSTWERPPAFASPLCTRTSWRSWETSTVTLPGTAENVKRLWELWLHFPWPNPSRHSEECFTGADRESVWWHCRPPKSRYNWLVPAMWQIFSWQSQQMGGTMKKYLDSIVSHGFHHSWLIIIHNMILEGNFDLSFSLVEALVWFVSHGNSSFS